jgi:hypothetical protein
VADPWASVSDVTEITGATVDAETLAQAQGVIELLVGRTADATWIPARDLRWLRRAVAYQAAWMPSQPDLFTRTEVASSSQDGASQVYRPDSHLLAPLARRALKKLTWRGNRSVHTESTMGTLRKSQYHPAAAGVGAVFDNAGERWVREEL